MFFSFRKMSRLEDTVDDVTSDRGARTEDSSVTHFLAEFLPVFFQLAWLSATCVTLDDSKWHVAVVC